MRRCAIAMVLLAMGCRPPATQEEACRRQAAANRMGRSFQPNPALDQLEQMRCDNIGATERAEQRVAAAEKREIDARQAELARMQAAQQHASEARSEQAMAEIRASHRAPEINATRAEVELLCAHEHGKVTRQDSTIGCEVGGPLIFVAVLDAGERVERVDSFLEGGDVSEARIRMEKSVGPYDREALTPDGFRVFLWTRIGVALTTYKNGIRVTLVR
jgi:hypothetical protein